MFYRNGKLFYKSPESVVQTLEVLIAYTSEEEGMILAVVPNNWVCGVISSMQSSPVMQKFEAEIVPNPIFVSRMPTVKEDASSTFYFGVHSVILIHR